MSFGPALLETCEACDGLGEVYVSDVDYVCPVCEGAGKVDAEENMTLERWERLNSELWEASFDEPFPPEDTP